MTAALLSVIAILFLLVILFEPTEIRVLFSERLVIKIETILFSVTLSDFKKKRKKKKRRPQIRGLLTATRYLLGHGEFFIRRPLVSDFENPKNAGIFLAIISSLYAYSDSIGGRLLLSAESFSSENMALDVSYKSRLFVYLCAFLIYKVKIIKRRFNL